MRKSRVLAAAAALAAGLAGAPRGEGIELGGQQVRRDRFIVYLLIGHSNMAGRDGRRADTVPHPRCWNFRWYADETWVPAVETRQGNRGLTPRGSGGPGMAWLKLMAERHPNCHFGVILVANPAACAAPGGNSFSKGCDRYEELIRAARAVQEEVTFGGIVAQLGICDRSRRDAAENFAKNMCQLVRDVRADLNEPKMPLLIGQYEMNSTGGYDPRSGWAPEIIRQINSIPKQLDYVAIVDSVGVPCLDDHHYTFEGHVEWCRRAIKALEDSKWFPPPGHLRAGATSRPKPPPLPPYVPPPEPDKWPATRNGLIFLWETGKADNFITDPARGRPRPCKLTSRGRAVLGADFEMDTAGGSFIAQDADDEVIFHACRATGQLALEATILPREARQRDAHILAYIPEDGPPDFALVQEEEGLVLKFRAGAAVSVPLSANLGVLEPGRPRHVLVSFVGGLLTCYVDGRPAARRTDLGGGFGAWQPGRLVFGDTWLGGHNWRGRLEGVAIYSRHVGADTAEAKSKLYRAIVRQRTPPPRVELEGRLLAKSTPAPDTGVYGQALILYRYAVRQVLGGAYPHDTIQVAHWGGLADRPVPEILDRRIGQTYTLAVEPVEKHPELAPERVGADAEDIDLPRYYDAQRPLRDEPQPHR